MTVCYNIRIASLFVEVNNYARTVENFVFGVFGNKSQAVSVLFGIGKSCEYRNSRHERPVHYSLQPCYAVELVVGIIQVFFKEIGIRNFAVFLHVLIVYLFNRNVLPVFAVASVASVFGGVASTEKHCQG